MDNASEIYSLYSNPTSCGTSATCSVELPAPLDRPTAQKHDNSAFVGPRVMPNNKAGLSRVQSSSSRSTASRYEDEILEAFPNPPGFRSPEEYGPEPYEEYFSVPASKGRLGLDDARRPRSTKELIKRFESISADNSPMSLSGHGTRGTPGRIHEGNPSLFTPPSKVEKKTSPLRQSFRNLLSVFKKGKRSGKERMEHYETPSDSEPPVESVPSGLLKRENERDPFTFYGRAPSSRICASPTYSLHRGPLLHLSPPVPTSSIFPVWVTCDATLHGSHILLTSATTQGIQGTVVVSLRACTDIKSLAPDEIAAEQRALLPAMEDSTDPKVFELFFDGKESQRFASPTVKDRAAWVSAIWDAILHGQETRRLERTKAEIKSSLRIDVGAILPSPAITPLLDFINENVLTPPGANFSDAPNFRDREVPPLPLDLPARSVSLPAPSPPVGNHSQSGLRNVLATSVISVGPKSPIDMRQDLELAPLTSQPFGAQSHSPSVVNLSRRSVVRKRLVEMQHSSKSSSTTSRDPPLPPRHTGAPLFMERVETPRSSVSSRAPPSRNVPDGRLPSPVSAVSDSPTLSPTLKTAFRLRDEMRSRDPTVAPTHDTSDRPSPTPTTTTTTTTTGHPRSEQPIPVVSISAGTIDALLDIMDVHAERQLIKTGELDDKLEDVQDGVREIAANFHVAISGREEDSRNLAELCAAMGNIRSVLAYLSTKTSNTEVPEQEEAQAIMESGPPPGGTVDGEVKSTLMASEMTSEFLSAGHGAGRTNNKQGETILHDEGKSTQLMEQQAESVRYLNELNAWLEAFVNGSTAQFGAISEGVQKLCKALGSVEELRHSPDEDVDADHPARTMSLLQSVQKLIADNLRRDRDSAHLLTTMNGLAAALNEDMRKNAEMRNAYTTESVLGAIERQRRDQERMLRALANELSDDIRGERLRFVEAMKEATAINVQIHVEEFKKELTREVLISTQEVDRLQRERQLLEQQIADLFGFYSKQKQSALGPKGDAVSQSRSSQQNLQPLDPGSEQNRSPSRGRALPLPPPDQKRRP